MISLEYIDENDSKSYEINDLVKFIGQGNEITKIG